jgi:fimbrial chaperone protein
MGLRLGRVGPALAASIASFLVVATLCVAAAHASTVGVSPVNITLDRSAPTALLTLTNQGDHPVTFSMNTYAWTQGASGKIELEPTSDIIFFPQSLSLAAGESRNVRIGSQLASGPVEKTYRIVLDELPPARTMQSTRTGMQIQILSQITIPIFIEPVTARVQMEIDDLAAHKGYLQFQVRNIGSVHVVPELTVIANGQNGEQLFTLGPQHVWYILADGARNVNVLLPAKDCHLVRSLSVAARAGTLVVKQSLQTPSGACAQ